MQIKMVDDDEEPYTYQPPTYQAPGAPVYQAPVYQAPPAAAPAPVERAPPVKEDPFLKFLMAPIKAAEYLFSKGPPAPGSPPRQQY